MTQTRPQSELSFILTQSFERSLNFLSTFFISKFITKSVKYDAEYKNCRNITIIHFHYVFVESEERAIITNHFFPIFLIFERFDVPELYA